VEQLKALTRRLRKAHGRAKDISARQQHEIRGKGDPRGVKRLQDNTGSLEKVRVLFDAIQRVDGELSRREETKMGTPSQAELSRRALELKMSSQTGEQPDPGRSSSEGMRPKREKSCLRSERLGKKSAASRRREKWRRRAGTARAEAAALQRKLFPGGRPVRGLA